MNGNLEKYKKTNLIIWISILSGIILLTILVLVLNYAANFYPYPDIRTLGELLFIIAIVLAFAILLLKRTFFRPEKIVERASNIPAVEGKENFILLHLRRNYIIIWMLAESIGMIGFIFYIFTSDLGNYLLFALISIYSLVINYPRQELIRNCLDRINQYGPSA